MYRQANSRTGAVFCVGGMENDGVLRCIAAVIVGHDHVVDGGEDVDAARSTRNAWGRRGHVPPIGRLPDFSIDMHHINYLTAYRLHVSWKRARKHMMSHKVDTLSWAGILNMLSSSCCEMHSINVQFHRHSQKCPARYFLSSCHQPRSQDDELLKTTR